MKSPLYQIVKVQWQWSQDKANKGTKVIIVLTPSILINTKEQMAAPWKLLLDNQEKWQKGI